MFLIFGFLEVSENIFTPKISGFTVYHLHGNSSACMLGYDTHDSAKQNWFFDQLMTASTNFTAWTETQQQTSSLQEGIQPTTFLATALDTTSQ